MRRKEREITDINKILEIISRCSVVRLGYNDDGEVYIVPLNFGYTYENDTLVMYFHGAYEGRKIDIMKKNNKVGFEMDCDIIPHGGENACQYGTAYSSVIGTGTAETISDPAEKMEALKIFMKCQTGKDFEFNERMAAAVNVFKVTADKFSCKQRPNVK